MKEGVLSWTVEGDSPRNPSEKKGSSTPAVIPFAERQTIVSGTWSHEITLQLANEEEIAQFNSCPYLTAVLLTCSHDKKNLQMLTFASLDCSGLLINEGSVSCRSPCREGAYVDLKLESTEPLLSENKLIAFEPLELNLHRFCSPLLTSHSHLPISASS
jgi:hypothetical protein